MKFVNKYLRNFVPYKLASHKIWTVNIDERKNVLKLDWNEATIAPSPKVEERIKKLVSEPSFYNLYPSTCNKELLELLAKYLNLPTENLQYFAGSDSLHEYVAKLYITVGDPVLLLGPTYDNFRLTAEVCGANIYYYNIDESFHFDKNGFIKKIDDIEPSIVYICNPNNPIGTLLSVSYIKQLLDSYPQVLFLIDEAYAEFSGVSAKELVLDYENVLISRTMSKAFALANFRFGYLIASKNNIEYISSIRNPKNITTFAQEAAMGALSDIPYMKKYVNMVNFARNQFMEDLRHYNDILDCIPGNGNFVLLKFHDVGSKRRFIVYLERYDIYVRDVAQTEFLKKYCVRITVGTNEQMKYVSIIIGEFWRDENEKNSSS